MNYHFTSAFLLQALPCLFALSLILILWKRRQVKGVIYLILLEFVASIWALTDAFEHAATTLPLKIFWSQMGNFGSTTTAVFLLLFTLQYTQQSNYITRKFVFLLFIIPAITTFLAFTNPLHHLIWKEIEFFPLTNESIYHYGLWFWIFIPYEYGLTLISIIILLLSTFRFYNIYKNQVVFLISASVFPLITSILYIFKLTPLKADLTPISLIFSGTFIGLGIFWQGIIDILPLARKQIINYLSDGVIVIDMAERIVDANPAILTIFGYSQIDLIGKPFEIIKHKLFNQVQGKNPTEGTLEAIINVDQEDRFFEIKINPVTLSNQNLIGKIFILHDITQRKKALDSAVASNNLLRKEIVEKEKLIIDLDAYARSVAHDLKNPISGLLGLKDIIKEDFNNNNIEEIFDLLDMAHEQGLKMYKIVDDLLLLSRIRKEDIRPVPLDMASILGEAIKRLNGRLENNDVSVEMPDSWPKVLGHSQWIEEVWYNFISNAIKYGGTPPVIKIGAEKINEYEWRFWIQDNGDGLPADTFSRIFNDFERLDKINTEGHGLGLSIIKRIIEKLGGEICVTSENIAGQGCTFSFTLRSADEKVV